MPRSPRRRAFVRSAARPSPRSRSCRLAWRRRRRQPRRRESRRPRASGGSRPRIRFRRPVSRRARFSPERYRIIGLLGHGGMGEVYRADDLKLGQPVALKFLPAGSPPTRAASTRFHNEVRIGAPGLAPQRLPRLRRRRGRRASSSSRWSTWTARTSRRSCAASAGCPEDKALDIARQLCAGLAAAHDKGVLHRDLKPANVMLDGRGRVAHHGLRPRRDRRRTTRRQPRGTPAYMAPEQLAGKGSASSSDSTRSASSSTSSSPASGPSTR